MFVHDLAEQDRSRTQLIVKLTATLEPHSRFRAPIPATETRQMRRELVLALLVLCPPAFAQQSTSLRRSTSFSQSTSFRSNPAHTGVYDSPGAPTFHKV